MAKANSERKTLISDDVLPGWTPACRNLSPGLVPWYRTRFAGLWMEEHKPDLLFPFARKKRHIHQCSHASEILQESSQGGMGN